MKDKGFIFTLSFLVGTGVFAWIREGWNVYTLSMFAIALFLIVAKRFGK